MLLTFRLIHKGERPVSGGLSQPEMCSGSGHKASIFRVFFLNSLFVQFSFPTIPQVTSLKALFPFLYYAAAAFKRPVLLKSLPEGKYIRAITPRGA